MKICVIGTHGAGKTTLAFLLASHYKKLGKNVKLIQEVARSCPYPINHGMTKEACLWIYHEHARKELEASQYHDTIVCDRSVLDSFVYAKHFNIGSDEIKEPFKSALNHLNTQYHKIIYVRPDLPIEADGVRATDEPFQKSVDEWFSRFLSGIKYTEVKSSQIFNPEEPWKHFC